MSTTQYVIANNVNTQLAAAASSSATTLTLASSANLPTLSAGQQMPLTLNDAATGQNYEIVYVTAITGVTLTVLRAQEGTGALTWNVGDYAFCGPTAGTVATTDGNPNNQFMVAAATAANQAPNLGQLQGGGATYAVATGTANAHVIALTPALTSRVDGMMIRYKAPAANTGALTLNDGLGAVAVVGGAHAALQGGETVTNGDVWVQWNSSIGGGSYIMLDSSGGALQIAPATASQHAVQLGQALGKFKLYTGTGTFNFTVPTGVTTVYATSVPPGGGGGGGGSAIGSASSSGAAGGGGGGGTGVPIIKQAITVAPGQVLTITHGSPGAAGTGSPAIATAATAGGIGGNVTIVGTSPTVNVTVTGGIGGNPANNANGSSSTTVSTGGGGGSSSASAGGFGIVASSAAFGGQGGQGGASMFGGGGGMTLNAGGNQVGPAGNAAPSYGAGGSGGGGGAALSSVTVEAGANGGAGGTALTLMEW